MNDQIDVDLGNRSYPILLCDGQLNLLGRFLERLIEPTRCVVLSDENVAPLYADSVISSLHQSGYTPHLLTIAPGEQEKSLQTFEALCREMIELEIDRSSFLVALGGGVVGDVGGFVASAYMRGIPYVQVPTTLLAQVDSSVGGKTAVNLPDGKNLVGAFYQPSGVYVDSSVLGSLADRDVRAGMVEVIKYGIIRDSEFFSWLEHNLTPIMNLQADAMLRAIHRSCEIKADVVAADERESGVRAILNYGHTIGHAVETLSQYGYYRHGEAVAIGMAASAHLAHQHRGLSVEDMKRQSDILRRLDVPTTIHDQNLSVEQIVRKMASDKKSVDGQPRFILANQIGDVSICADVPDSLMRNALRAIGADDV